MKANVPKKFYTDENGLFPTSKCYCDSDIEYIRKDAFIEKACEFIKDHHHEFSFWNMKEYELEFSTQKFIDEFKNYMKGK